jgi:hypothetical protein
LIERLFLFLFCAHFVTLWSVALVSILLLRLFGYASKVCNSKAYIILYKYSVLFALVTSLVDFRHYSVKYTGFGLSGGSEVLRDFRSSFVK